MLAADNPTASGIPPASISRWHVEPAFPVDWIRASQFRPRRARTLTLSIAPGPLDLPSSSSSPAGNGVHPAHIRRCETTAYEHMGGYRYAALRACRSFVTVRGRSNVLAGHVSRTLMLRVAPHVAPIRPLFRSYHLGGQIG